MLEKIEIHKAHRWSQKSSKSKPARDRMAERAADNTVPGQYCLWKKCSVVQWHEVSHFTSLPRNVLPKKGSLPANFPTVSIWASLWWCKKNNWGSDTSTSQFGSKIPQWHEPQAMSWNSIINCAVTTTKATVIGLKTWRPRRPIALVTKSSKRTQSETCLSILSLNSPY